MNIFVQLVENAINLRLTNFNCVTNFLQGTSNERILSFALFNIYHIYLQLKNLIHVIVQHTYINRKISSKHFFQHISFNRKISSVHLLGIYLVKIESHYVTDNNISKCTVYFFKYESQSNCSTYFFQ